jgi:hypothetical protein
MQVSILNSVSPCTRVQKQGLRNTGECLDSVSPVYQSPGTGPQKYRSVSRLSQFRVPESISRTSEIQICVLIQPVLHTRVRKQDLRNTGQCFDSVSPGYRIPKQDLRNTNLCLDSVSWAYGSLEQDLRNTGLYFVDSVSPMYQRPETGPQKCRSVFLTQSVPCPRVQKQDLRNTGQYFWLSSILRTSRNTSQCLDSVIHA